MARLSCGVIGLGRLGFKHAQNIAGRIAGARLTAAADPAAAMRENLKNQFSAVEVYEDYHDLVSRGDIDAVVIASSTTTHGAIIMDCLKAGKAVFCEKPVTLDMDEAERL
ncbi:MAG: Gfo/Idh/MocA family oxidoreductase, partial [Treponema sp.]|nr:Gfo/Idh/MocA family oxidoreductase [Treponema sp.]